jgi:hypothetical protein
MSISEEIQRLHEELSKRNVASSDDLKDLIGGILVFADKIYSTTTPSEQAKLSLWSPKDMKRFELEELLCPTRLVQAFILFQKGFGEKLSFAEYLHLIPEIPAHLLAHDEKFPDLILVDQRHGLVKACAFAGLRYSLKDCTFKEFYPKKARTSPIYWMRCQDGRENRGKSIKTCRVEFVKKELALTAQEGIALYVQKPEVIKDHFVNLLGSKRGGGSGIEVACLGPWGGPSGVQPGLYFRCHLDKNARFGSGSCRV